MSGWVDGLLLEVLHLGIGAKAFAHGRGCLREGFSPRERPRVGLRGVHRKSKIQGIVVHAPGHLLFDHPAKNLPSRQSGQVFDLRLQLFPHLDQRERQMDCQLLASDDFKAVLGLTRHSLICVFHSGSPLESRLITPDSIRVRVESRYFFLQVSTKSGTTSATPLMQ